MTALFPNQFLFHYTIPIRYHPRLPKSGNHLLNLTDQYCLPFFGGIDDIQPFGELKMTWHEAGLGFSVEVTGKAKPISVNPRQPELSDGLRIWIDTRNTKQSHRASKFCHQFCFLPVSPDETAGQAAFIQLPISQAKDPPPQIEAENLVIKSTVTAHGYLLEVWIPADQLYGFDCSAEQQIGFHYLLRDSELGLQSLTVGEEFPITHDPSQWSTLKLTRSEQ